MRMQAIQIGRSLLLLGVLALVGACSSGKIRDRKEQRDKMVTANGGHFCDFVNGEVYPDVEVQLNLEVGKHCEPETNVTITNYRSPSDNIGIIYCCISKSDVKLDKADKKSKDGK